MNVNDSDNLENDLNFLVVNGLVEIVIGNDGETRYKTTENSKKFTEQQLIEIIIKGLEDL